MILDFSRYEAMTFDCYGTLIDWEAGILAAFRTLFGAHGAQWADREILEAHARHEARIEAAGFLRYREVLAEVARAVCDEFGIEVNAVPLEAFGGSVAAWPAFTDSSVALTQLARGYQLGVITNCDDDLFAASNARLGVTFDPIVTAQQVGSYKPAIRNFEVMFERIGVPRERILHVAQSIYHDHVPAKSLGLTTVWVDRRQGRDGTGATPAATAEPDLVVPDMATLAALAGAGSSR
jgi:2-haloacid dehalogenase